jgi:DNA-binding HxlR family transcriptional regulator
MNEGHRSHCPINLSLEVFGDRWTLLILRDLVFGGKRHFREFLQSEERIASNILADRLNRLVTVGILSRADDPTHKQKAVYSLTEMGIELLPILIQISSWGRRYLAVGDEEGERTRVLEAGGAPLVKRLTAELRLEHLGRGPAARARAPRLPRSAPGVPLPRRQPKAAVRSRARGRRPGAATPRSRRDACVRARGRGLG